MEATAPPIPAAAATPAAFGIPPIMNGKPPAIGSPLAAARLAPANGVANGMPPSIAAWGVAAQPQLCGTDKAPTEAACPRPANPPRPPPTPAKPSPVKKCAQATRAPIVAPGTQEFEAIRALLARHIGPIAKVFVEKAATEASTPDEFCERLAAHVAAPSDRMPFVTAVRARLAVKS